MKRVAMLMLACCLLLALPAAARASEVTVVVDGRPLLLQPPALLWQGRTFLPLRGLAEALGAVLTWDAATRTVQVESPARAGERYLQGLTVGGFVTPDIRRDLLGAAELRDLLDDDRDGDLADYRAGHSGGDSIANDPLLVDVRSRADFDAGHIPGAVWIAPAVAMGSPAAVDSLRSLLAAHVAAGGRNEAVLYCYTGHQSGLVAGVLGARGLPVRNLMYGFDLAWTGSRQAPAPVAGPVEATPDTGTCRP
ncbi:MAG: stalk domain-containing protein [Syntrophomonadaceae bacterium]|jgi:rhodanese-related sulfurtransferase|nr:stalk domain-containing protein [Syntrophomonadaceae bacterium]MDH7497201.1 stalk domain-containing protein [Syntrophomonadaceae bacterium]